MKRIVYADPLALEVFLGWLAVVVGVLWLLPGDTFAISGAYVVIRKIAPEAVWGVALLLLGVVALLGATLRLDKFRRTASLLMAGVWMALGIGFITVSFATSGGWVFLCCALGSGWLAWRMR